MELADIINDATVRGVVGLVPRDRETDEVGDTLWADVDGFRIIDADTGFFDYWEDPVTSIYAGEGPNGPAVFVEVAHLDDSGTLGFTHYDTDGNLVGGLVIHEFDTRDDRDRWVSDGYREGDRGRGPIGRRWADANRAFQPKSWYVDHRTGR